MIGVKDTKGKPRVDLIPYDALVAFADVREFGNNKYGSPNKWYDKDLDYYEHPERPFIAAGIRHLYKHLDAITYNIGSIFDDESGKLHLAHAITTIGMAISLMNKGD